MFKYNNVCRKCDQCCWRWLLCRKWTWWRRKGSSYGGGAGHGGRGGITTGADGGIPYGNPLMPILFGSGGGYGGANRGGSGGGIIIIEAQGIFSNNGTILADGENAPNSYGGGGAGGSIFIQYSTFYTGSNGMIRARGGTSNFGGGGSGGRIALVYTNILMDPDFKIDISAGGIGWSTSFKGYDRFLAGRGTLHLSDTNFLSENMVGIFSNVDLVVPGWTSWVVDNNLVVSNCYMFIASDGFQLNVVSNLIINKGHLGIGVESGISNPVLSCGGNIILTNGGMLTIYAGSTNTNGKDYGGLLSVTGDIWISPGSWLIVYSHSNDGSSVKVAVSNLWVIGSVMSNQGIRADGRGFGLGKGPGTPAYYPSSYWPGAGHGGKGGLFLKGRRCSVWKYVYTYFAWQWSKYSF